MSEQSGQGWFMIDEPTTAVPVTHARTHGGVDRLLDAFVLLVFLAPFGLAGTFLAWLDLGSWNDTLTWSGSISAGTLLLGIAAAVIGDRRDRARHTDTAEEQHQ